MSTPKHTPRALTRFGAVACVIGLALTGCGSTASSVGGGAATDDAAVQQVSTLPTLRGSCPIVTNGTCRDVMAESSSLPGSYNRMSLINADFRRADLSGSSFSGTSARFADFSNADLSNVDFTNADLSGSRFDGAKLNGAVLAGANLTGTSLTGVNLDSSDLSGTTQAALRCKNPAGGVCAQPVGKGATFHVNSLPGDGRDFTFDINGDQFGRIKSAVLSVKLTADLKSPVPANAELKMFTNPALNFSKSISLKGDSGTVLSYDLTADIISAFGSDFVPLSTFGIFSLDAYGIDGYWAGGGPAPVTGAFSASANSTYDHGTLAYSMSGDESGKIVKATASASASQLPLAGSVLFTVTPPGGSVVEANFDLPDPPLQVGSPQTWDITGALLGALKSDRFPEYTSISAQFFEGDSGGSVGNPMASRWMPGGTGTGYSATDSVTSAQGSGNFTMNVSGDSAARVTGVSFVVDADASLTKADTILVEAYFPEGDHDETWRSGPDLSAPVKPVNIAPGKQSIDVSKEVMAAWKTNLIPPNSVIKATALAGTSAQSGVASSSWSKGLAQAPPQEVMATNWQDASLVDVGLSCLDQDDKRVSTVPVSKNEFDKYKCAKISGIDFSVAKRFDPDPAMWGVQINSTILSSDPVDFNRTLSGKDKDHRRDLSWATISGLKVQHLRFVDLRNAVVDISVGDVAYQGVVTSIDASLAQLTLRRAPQSYGLSIKESNLAGAQVQTERADLNRVCLKGSGYQVYVSDGSGGRAGERANGITMDSVDFSGKASVNFSDLNGSTITNADFSDAKFVFRPNGLLTGNTWDTVNFNGADIGDTADWMHSNEAGLLLSSQKMKSTWVGIAGAAGVTLPEFAGAAGREPAIPWTAADNTQVKVGGICTS